MKEKQRQASENDLLFEYKELIKDTRFYNTRWFCLLFPHVIIILNEPVLFR